MNADRERKESNTESTMAAPAAPAAADASADMPTFKLVLVGDGGTGEDGFRTKKIRGGEFSFCRNFEYWFPLNVPQFMAGLFSVTRSMV